MIRGGAIEKALFGPMNVVLIDTLIMRKGLVMIIDAPPRFVRAFFRPVRSGLSKPQFHHLWTLVLGILLNLGRSKLTHLAGALPGHTHRTSCGVFLSRSDGDAEGLLNTEVEHLLRRMNSRRGETIFLVIDDTRIPKRGKKMFGVSKIWDHKQQRFVHGHIVVSAAVLFRGATLPWRFELWLAKRPRSSWKTMVAFATNETKLAARAIVSIYEKRWAIEMYQSYCLLCHRFYHGSGFDLGVVSSAA
jgi:hypothetical protein